MDSANRNRSLQLLRNFAAAHASGCAIADARAGAHVALELLRVERSLLWIGIDDGIEPPALQRPA